MKCTPFRRKPLPAKPNPRAGEFDSFVPRPRTPALRISDGKARLVVPVPKLELFRSEAYRRYVASKPCFGCGIEGFSQCAHPNFGKGMSMKTDDRLSFPLCGPRPGHIGCHSQHDLCIEMTKFERRLLEVGYTARMQAIAVADGRQEFKEES